MNETTNNCPECNAAFEGSSPLRYVEEGVTRTSDNYACGSFYVEIDGVRQFNQTHVCEIAALTAKLEAAERERDEARRVAESISQTADETERRLALAEERADAARLARAGIHQ